MAERKEKLIRVLQIMQSTDERSPLNATQIVDRLANKYELREIDRRSIYRDIVLLQSCGYDIEQCDDKRKGWYMKKHAFEDWEIKVMLDAVCQAKCISTEEASAIKEKLLALVSERGRSRLSHLMVPKSGNSKVTSELGKNIELMIEAMHQGKKIEFQYTELNHDLKRVLRLEGYFYKLNLYTICWDSNNYYLIGNHDKYDNLTHYRLDRIENMKISELDATPAEEKIGQNPELKIQEYIEKSVSQFSGDKVRITLEFTPNQTNNAIIHDFAGDDVMLKHVDNGNLRISFTKLNSPTLVSWLLENANRFTVVEPVEIREKIIEQLEESLKKYII